MMTGLSANPSPPPPPNVRAARRARSAQWLLEASVFTLAAVFVVTSAVKAKRSEFGPLLAAVEPTGESAQTAKPVRFIAATNDAAGAEIGAQDNGEPSAMSAELPVAPSNDAAKDLPSFGIGSVTPEPGAVRYFDKRPIRVKKTIWMTVTAYSPDARSCGASADGRTATNHSVWTNGMRLVAADPRLLPYKSMVSIPGYADGDVVPVLDCGGAIKGAHIDLLFSTDAEARRWGVKKLKVTVWEYAD